MMADGEQPATPTPATGGTEPWPQQWQAWSVVFLLMAAYFISYVDRTILALLVGAGLSISGAAFQGMFRNPLVSTDLLGVSAAAGCGAALAILLGANDVGLQAMAFIFGLAGVALTDRPDHAQGQCADRRSRRFG